MNKNPPSKTFRSLHDPSKFECQYTHNLCERRVFIPGASSRSRIGCFESVHAAAAHLRHTKPSGWRDRLQRLASAVGLDDPSEIVDPSEVCSPSGEIAAPPHLVETMDEYTRREQANRKRAAKRKRTTTTSNTTTSVPPAFAPTDPTQLLTLEATSTNGAGGGDGKYKLTIEDENIKRTYFTDDWRSELSKHYSLLHALPAYVLDAKTIRLYPLLACDGRSIKATPCRVTLGLR